MSHLQDRRGCSKWGTDNPIEVAMCMKINHRSEEHTSELQSLRHLVCRLLLEKKKQTGQKRGCDARRMVARTGSSPRRRPDANRFTARASVTNALDRVLSTNCKSNASWHRHAA